MQYSYRISKYAQGGSGLIYSDEWTSYFDVGSKVSLAEYLAVENRYIALIKAVCAYFQQASIAYDELEIYAENPELNLHNPIALADLDLFIQGILREQIWCKLKSAEFEFHFGYDFYLYLVCQQDLLPWLQAQFPTLNIHAFVSPYA